MTTEIIRSAYWVGQPHAGQEEQFRATINRELVPAMRGFPGVAAVRALWPQSREDSPPEFHCQVIVQFASEADMQRMMASRERVALRPRVLAAVEMFDGRLSHIDFQVA